MYIKQIHYKNNINKTHKELDLIQILKQVIYIIQKVKTRLTTRLVKQHNIVQT